MPSKNPWPVETPEEVIERTRRMHGDAVAEIVARDIATTPLPKRTGRKKVFAGERQNLKQVAARGGGSTGHRTPHRHDQTTKGARDDAR